MKKMLLFFFLAASFSMVDAQVYLDQFDDDAQNPNNTTAAGYTSTEADGEWTIMGDGSAGPWDVFTYIPYDASSGVADTLDVTGNNKVYVRAKAGNIGTQLRMDLEDAAGFVTTAQSISQTLLDGYTVFEFDFTDKYLDGGFGGTACAAGPCSVDGSKIVQLVFFINPGQGSFSGTVKLDYISVGSAPSDGPMSDVWQEHFEGDSLENFASASAGFTQNFADSYWTITGDGTNAMWDPMSILVYNQTTFEETDIDVSGNDKIYIRMKSTIPGTAIRLDLQDISDFATTAGSVTKVVADTFATYEFNFAGVYQDLAFGGTGCIEGPCTVDAERIKNMIIFVNPGVEAFAGEVQIDYISVGTALESNPGGELLLVYGDHFGEGGANATTDFGFTIEEDGSNLRITGDGSDPAFAAVAYTTHDMDSGEPVVVNMTGNNKFFFSAKSSVANTLLRVDMVDTGGYVTTLPSFTKILGTEYSDFEIDFTGQYIDNAYGGTSCKEGGDPCAVDGSAIRTILLYPNPADGGFTGTIDIEYLSFGAPLAAVVRNYEDHFDNKDRTNLSDAGGFTAAETGTELILTGDGSAGAYSSFGYTLIDASTGLATTTDITSNNKIYMKAKASVDGVPFRMDLLDADGFATTNPSVARNLTTEYMVYEFDYAGTYIDGGFGGTACATGPCPVDGERVAGLILYVDPDNGGYNGTVTIDWISTLKPLETVVDPGPRGIDEYADEFGDGDAASTTGATGLAVTEVGDNLIITGDGSGGPWTPVVYDLHDIAGGSGSILVNAVSNDNKLFVRAKSTTADLPIRIDLQDNIGYVTSNPSVQQNFTTDYSIVTFDYTGTYIDGGFGGTPCSIGPCAVDGERINTLQLFVNPSIGMFDGVIEIDWISFGQELSVGTIDEKFIAAANVFPNPTDGSLVLDMNLNQPGQMQVMTFDLMGRLVKQQSSFVQSGKIQEEVNLQALESGMYLMVVHLDGQQVLTHRVMKK